MEHHDRSDHRMERFSSDGRSGREDLEMSLTEQDLIKLMLTGCPIHGTAGGCSRTGFRQ